jgi:hypothetical protein
LLVGFARFFNFKFHSCDGGEALVSEENPGVEGMACWMEVFVGVTTHNG